MIKIYKPNKNYYSCQVCGCYKPEPEQNEVYAIELRNRNGQGTGLYLCKDCCRDLRNLLRFTQRNGVKMVSTDIIDK